MENWLDEHEDLSADDRELYEGKNFPDALTMLKEGASAYRRLSKSTTKDWIDNHEGLSDEDKQTLSKYTSQEEAMKGSAHAIRQVGKSLQMPDEKTSDEDRTAFNEKIATYQGVPKSAEGYKLEVKLPEGIEKDEDLDKWFRAVAFETKAPQNLAAKIYAGYNEMMVKRHEAMRNQAKEAEDALQKEWGDEFEAKIGKPGDTEKIGTCKMAALHVSKVIGADYKDDAGNPQSHLIDDLEILGKNGAIGDKISVVKMFDWVYQNLVREGVTLIGGALKKEGAADGEDVPFSDAWYKKEEGKTEEGGYGE